MQYMENIREIEKRSEIRQKHAKEWCEHEYENYKKKYESSVSNYSIFV